jgi:hypothetical protein
MVDINVENIARTRGLKAELPSLLIFPDEFAPSDHLEPYVFSRVSAPVALQQLKAIVAGVQVSGPDSVPPVPTFTVYRGPNPPAPVKRTVKHASVKPRRSSGIGTAPLQKDEDFE